jgi:tetratricopeptide (TPR) repeat protein
MALSPRSRVAASDRIDDTLSLMKRPLNSELTRAVAREIAVRDGAIAWVVVGSIDSSSRGPVVSAQVIDPASDQSVNGFQEVTTGPSDASDAGRRLGQQIRTWLEVQPAPPEAPDRAMQQVSTSSFEAWQDYVAALDTMKWRDFAATTELTRRAVELDPTFASAHMWVAWALRNNNLNQQIDAAVREEIAKAVALADSTHGPERSWILGSAYQLRGDSANAITQYEALVAVHPEHYWALNNLAILYWNVGQRARGAKLDERRADLYPTDFRANANAVESLLQVWEDTDRIMPIAARARRVMTTEQAHALPGPATSVLVAPADLAWRSRDARATSAALKDALADRRAAEDPVASLVIHDAANLFLSMGQVHAASAIMERLSSEGARDISRAQLDYYAGDPTSAITHAKSAARELRPGEQQPFLTSMLLRLGLVDEAQTELTRVDPQWLQSNVYYIAARGELAAAQHHDELAVEILTPAFLDKLTTGEYFRAARAISDVWVRKEDWQRAIDVLRLAVNRPYDNAVSYGSTIEGTEVRFRLAALYRHAGNLKEAEAIESDAMRGLDQADPGFIDRLRALGEVGLH